MIVCYINCCLINSFDLKYLNNFYNKFRKRMATSALLIMKFKITRRHNDIINFFIGVITFKYSKIILNNYSQEKTMNICVR